MKPIYDRSIPPLGPPQPANIAVLSRLVDLELFVYHVTEADSIRDTCLSHGVFGSLEEAQARIPADFSIVHEYENVRIYRDLETDRLRWNDMRWTIMRFVLNQDIEKPL